MERFFRLMYHPSVLKHTAKYTYPLYHRTATQADIRGKRVLEVGCGHGGGASHVSRYLAPASYTSTFPFPMNRLMR